MSGAGAGGRGSVASAPIPTGSRKLVQSLKEIVNCPEAEIYAMLRECNMDPNEAVQRLLAQDTFHEVKSKRDKKKEIREPSESRSRTVNNSSGRGARGGSDRVGHSTVSLSSLTDYGTSKSKSTHKKENGNIIAPVTSVLECATISSNPTRRLTVPSNSASLGNTISATGLADGSSIPTQPSPGLPNSNWLGKPGHISMADIVKMGRPQGKHSGLPVVTGERSYLTHNSAASNMSRHNTQKFPSAVLPVESDKLLDSFQESTHAPEVIHAFEGQHVSDDGWSLVEEQPAEYTSTAPEILGASSGYGTLPELVPSNLITDGSDLHIDSGSGDQDPEAIINIKSVPRASGLTSISEWQIGADTSKDASHLTESFLKGTDLYRPQSPEFDRNEGSFPAEDANVEISSAAASLKQLSVHEETTKPIEASPAVIIPNHLRVTNADCAHLSFGSFGSGAFSGSFPSKQLECNVDVAPAIDDAPLIEESDERNQEFYSNGQLKPTLSENVTSISATVSETLDVPSVPQPEIVANDSLDSTDNLQYSFPSVSNFSLPSSTQTNATPHTYLQGNAQMQSLSPFSSLMQPNPLQSSMFAASIPQLRDFDLPVTPLLTTQSMPTRYSTAVTSINGASITMPEALKPGTLSNPQSDLQSLPSTSTTMLMNPALPQPLPVHHYTQPALPLGHFANMISYPILPQSYTYLPSMQQAFSANSPFHQSAALSGTGMKYPQPQYKSSLPTTSLPQASAIASVYGGFGSPSSIPGGFNLNHTAPSASTTIGFDEALSLQYKEASHYLSLQQSENPAMWLHGAGSRTMPALPVSSFYNYQGQTQHGGFRQVQQPPQLSGLGYSNLYPQAAPSREHQQNPGEGNMNGSQSTQTQQSNQIWQHGY